MTRPLDTTTAPPSSPGTTVLEQMVSAFQVDWRAVNQRLRSHPHEARSLSQHANCNGETTTTTTTTTTILHLALQRRRSNYPPLQTLRRLLAIFPEAVWIGVDTCASPLHLLARHNPLPDYMDHVRSARPSVPDKDIQALLYQWDYHVRAFGGSQEDLVAFLLEGSREAARLYVGLANLLEYTIQVPVRRTEQFGLHTIAALTADLELLQIALSVFADQVDQRSGDCGRLPLHSFLATPADGRSRAVSDEILKTFRFPFDLLPLLRALVRAYPAALTTRDAHGQLPLHVAIVAGWDEFDILLTDFPDSLQAVDGKSGWLLPFQLAAVSPASSLDAVYRLLRRNPSALLQTPLDIIENHLANETNIECNEAIHHCSPVKYGVSDDFMRLAFRVGQAECSRLWDSLRILLTDSLAPQRPGLLHVLAGLPHCPRGLLQAMTHFHYPVLRTTDTQGRLPLHWLATVSQKEEQDYAEQGDADETCLYVERLDYLLQMDPSACLHRDRNGQMPLHLAVTEGLMPWQGLQRLIDNCPQTLRKLDGPAQLPPALTGAYRLPLNEIYLLLTAAPDVIDERTFESSSNSLDVT